MGSKLDSFLRKWCFLFCFSHVEAYIVTGNEKKITSIGLSYKDVMLFKKNIYVFDVVYVKSKSMFVCKVICPKAGLSLDMHYQGSAYLSLLNKRKERGSMPSPFLTESVALWEYLSMHTQTRVLQIQLLSMPYLK